MYVGHKTLASVKMSNIELIYSCVPTKRLFFECYLTMYIKCSPELDNSKSHIFICSVIHIETWFLLILFCITFPDYPPIHTSSHPPISFRFHLELYLISRERVSIHPRSGVRVKKVINLFVTRF